MQKVILECVQNTIYFNAYDYSSAINRDGDFADESINCGGSYMEVISRLGGMLGKEAAGMYLALHWSQII